MSEDASGLLELPAELQAGAALVEALGLDDTILEVNLTPNRGDCMSVLGIAREVAALTGQPLTGPALVAVPAASKEIFPVELTAGAGCVRFASRVIRGLDPQAKSPAWMQERLRRAGLRPISAAVDVTNYVMLELGQPLHAYDLRELAGGIVVRRARAGETLKLLDGREITMDESVLVIADHEKSLGLAGVMGGDHSGIGDDTADVLLEVAFFLPEAIAGRGRRYGLVTDASQRFERGVDPTLQERAIERATALLCACAGGVPGPTQLVELPAELPRPAAAPLRPERARRVIGADIDDATIAAMLDGLGMQVEQGGEHMARDAADVALRHRHRGRPDRGDRAHARVRSHSRNGAASAAADACGDRRRASVAMRQPTCSCSAGTSRRSPTVSSSRASRNCSRPGRRA